MSLKDLTLEKHKDAERSVFARKLMSGEISTSDYINYLVQMGYIYRVLETKAIEAKIFNDLPGISRSQKIQSDIVELAGEDHGIQYLGSTINYVDYIKSLKDTDSILAHVYVRHMGDLYGGQMIAKRVPGSGLFYQFEDRDVLINTLRSKLTDDLGVEANTAFDYTIAIMRELNDE
jgi:heme oxygenase